jgi:uncharacterized protein YrrD
MRAGDLIGLPVVSIRTGEDVAEVRDVVYDASRHRLVGFTLNKRGALAGRLKDVLATDSLAAIGSDAVMVDSEDSLSTADDAPDALRSPEATTSVVGKRVLSADGDDLGEVVGVIVATGSSPAAVGYEIGSSDRSDTAFVPISEQMALSEDNLLLPANATDFVRNDLAGFGAAVESYRADALSGGDR